MDAPGEPLEEGVADEGPPPAAGFVGSFRRMIATLVAIVHTRVELFTTEIEEEIQRAASILLWALIALFFGSLTVLMIAVTVLVIFWDDHRILAASLITGTFLLLTLTFALLARKQLRAKPRFMEASLAELRRDKEGLERAI
ncbi:MAG TPA: phage holin family protein [Steroidobacteraceae bacterium]|jgi:uncharacterized membrane protein YqjE